MTDIESLKGLRAKFPDHQISKLPKPSKQQTDQVKADYKQGIRCQICGGWHHKDVVHLDYVGHAALTDRLLDVDPTWSWEPLALGQDGYPVIDKDGGIWIKLTVCGVTRLGYGDAQGKTGGDAMKERIGDALRNAAMRFGAALDLWHKGDLHIEAEQPQIDPEQEYKDLCESLTEEIAEIKIGINKKDYARAYSAWSLLGEETQTKLWKAPSKGGCFTTEERSIMKTPEFRASHTVGNK